MKNDTNKASKSTTQKNYEKKNLLVAVLKGIDGNSRIRIRIRIWISNPDSLVRGTDPRFRVINKMSRIRNTGGI